MAGSRSSKEGIAKLCYTFCNIFSSTRPQAASSGSAIQEHSLAISPTFQTDRAFDREARQLSVSWTVKAKAVGRSGLYTYLGKDPSKAIRIAWAPTLTLLAGKVEDAGGNAALQAIADAGSYKRAQLRISTSVQPGGTERLTLGFDYFWHHDLDESWTRGYLEASAYWDANAAKNVQITAVYRKGKPAPAFGRTDRFLLGLSVLQ